MNALDTRIIGKATIHNIDCMDLLKATPDKFYDLAIVDPPYGIGDFVNSLGKKHHKKIDWNNEIPTIEYFNELQRVSKNKIVFGFNYYRDFIKDKGIIVHDKTGGGRRFNPKELSNVDIASHSFNNTMKIYHYTWIGNVQGSRINWDNNGADGRIHPCQKPISLYEWLLNNYAKQGDKILDTHLGSGSHAIACNNLGFELTACELDTDYFNAACKRIEQASKQTSLFEPSTLPKVQQEALL
jgi:site-specific DNA-methyltransferase (adenine-specific)